MLQAKRILIAFPISIHGSLKVCDFDMCDNCCKLPVVVPAPLLERVPSPVAVVSPFRGTLAVIQSHVRDIPDIVNVSSDLSPPPPQIHPFFLPHQPPRENVQTETHEMRFHALARQPVVPATSSPHPLSRRAAGRLRLRVSTPVLPPQAVHNATAPRRQLYRIRLSTPNFTSPLQYPDLAGLAISTPPRIGCPHFTPRLLFPDSPLPSPIQLAGGSPAPQRVLQSCDAGVQTVPHHDVLTHTCEAAVQCDPQPGIDVLLLHQPLTLQHFQSELQILRNELRVLVMGFGF